MRYRKTYKTVWLESTLQYSCWNVCADIRINVGLLTSFLLFFKEHFGDLVDKHKEWVYEITIKWNFLAQWAQQRCLRADSLFNIVNLLSNILTKISGARFVPFLCQHNCFIFGNLRYNILKCTCVTFTISLLASFILTFSALHEAQGSCSETWLVCLPETTVCVISELIVNFCFCWCKLLVT